MIETRQHRLKKLKMRSMRRGIKEMDMILIAFSEANLADMDADTLDQYEALLHENDQDLYQWVTGQVPVPDPYGDLIANISQSLQK